MHRFPRTAGVHQRDYRLTSARNSARNRSAAASGGHGFHGGAIARGERVVLADGREC